MTGNETMPRLNDVAFNFDTTLKMFEAYFVVEVVRAVLMLAAIRTSNKKVRRTFAWTHFILSLNDFFGGACLGFLMYSRFSVPGRLCSGDFLGERLIEDFNDGMDRSE